MPSTNIIKDSLFRQQKEEKEQFNQEMAESSKVYSLENIWFGLKRKRRDVVFDTTVQTFHSDSQVGKNCYV